MTTREECESQGMAFVKAFKNVRGHYVPAFCRKKREYEDKHAMRFRSVPEAEEETAPGAEEVVIGSEVSND